MVTPLSSNYRWIWLEMTDLGMIVLSVLCCYATGMDAVQTTAAVLLYLVGRALQVSYGGKKQGEDDASETSAANAKDALSKLERIYIVCPYCLGHRNAGHSYQCHVAWAMRHLGIQVRIRK